MNESAGYKACLGVPNITPKNAIADCVADIRVINYFSFYKWYISWIQICTVIQLFVTFVIKLTNSTSWATASREGLKALCFKELSQNNTFQESTNEKNGGSFVESILSVTCPSECHQRGICKNGKIAILLKVVSILMKW